MNARERVAAALRGERCPETPATLHGWGVYKFQHAGVSRGPEDEGQGWMLRGEALAAVERRFWADFRPDTLQLNKGAWLPQPGDAERRRALAALRPAVMELRSKQAIDDYVAATTPTLAEIEASQALAHIPPLVRDLGGEVMILYNEGNPVCGVFENGGPVGDFNDALIATLEHPDNLGYLLWKLYDAELVWMHALRRAGAHGYIGSETCVSADILRPAAFRAMVLPALKHFYTQAAGMGLFSITYFLGDVNPLLADIAGMGGHGLMVEESKKNFTLDVLDLRRRLDGRVALFGNVDSVYHLRYGTPEAAAAEARRQVEAAKEGPFILANGSPLPFDTPAANIHAMLRVPREGLSPRDCLQTSVPAGVLLYLGAE